MAERRGPGASTTPQSPRAFVLIRHAKPRVDAALQSREWNLSEAGREATKVLARTLRGVDLAGIVSSDEVKARQTGEILAAAWNLPMGCDERLGEVRRPWTYGDFRRDVLSYLADEPHDQWESYDDVHRRMALAVAISPWRGLTGYVTHGTAMSVLLAARGVVEAGRFWTDLHFADVWFVSGTSLERLSPW